MNNKFVLLALASVFLLLTVIGAQLTVAATVDRTVGVSVGDWAKYDVTYSGNKTMPEMENITWTRVTVQEISGTNITYEIRIHFANDTEETETRIIDVDTGQGNSTAFFIAANLNAGDLIYNSTVPDDMFYGMTINETIFRTYPVGNVEVNHWNLTTGYSIPEVINQTTSVNFYWYKSTGMITEMSVYQLYEVPEGNTTWFEMGIVISDIISKFPPALILPLFTIAILTIAILTAVWLGKKIWSTKKSIKKTSPCA